MNKLILADPPNHLTVSTILLRFIDAIAFRFEHAVQNLNDNEIQFRPSDESMNIAEVSKHICHLVLWIKHSLNPESERTEIPKQFDELNQLIHKSLEDCRDTLSDMGEDELEKLTLYLKRENKHYSFWYLINGPISDILTHIGQIVTWRRSAGNPVARISPFNGKAYA